MITRDDQPVAVRVSLPGEVSDVIVEALTAALVASFARVPVTMGEPPGGDVSVVSNSIEEEGSRRA